MSLPKPLTALQLQHTIEIITKIVITINAAVIRFSIILSSLSRSQGYGLLTAATTAAID
jgi:hypothetical protein